METLRTTGPTIATPCIISALPPRPIGTTSGVENLVLWQDGTSMAGVLTVPGGLRLGRHTHRHHHHHMWVLEGRAAVFDEELPAGSYIHIPAGVAHDLDATHTDGCRVFYLYVRPGD